MKRAEVTYVVGPLDTTAILVVKGSHEISVYEDDSRTVIEGLDDQSEVEHRLDVKTDCLVSIEIGEATDTAKAAG